MTAPKTTVTLGDTPEAKPAHPHVQAPAPAPAPAPAKKPSTQAFKCVHPHGLDFNGATYKSAQRYVFTEADLYEGGWLDCQVKAGLFEPTE